MRKVGPPISLAYGLAMNRTTDTQIFGTLSDRYGRLAITRDGELGLNWILVKLTDLAMKFVSFVDFMELVQRRQFVCGQRLLLQEFLCRIVQQLAMCFED